MFASAVILSLLRRGLDIDKLSAMMVELQSPKKMESHTQWLSLGNISTKYFSKMFRVLVPPPRVRGQEYRVRVKLTSTA